MKLKLINLVVLLVYLNICQSTAVNDLNKQLNEYKKRVKDMFYFAYNNYINNAYPYDELKPISCSGFDTWGSYSLTLIDSLDMLIILGNRTEFERVVKLIEKNIDFDKDINVSVFETNIRVIGGLLSAHLLSYKLYEDELIDNFELKTYKLDPNWPCDGPLLRKAVRFADKLLPAFNTSTGMPYGTVNLKYGVPKGETTETCTAGVGTFIVEFATISRLTGNPVYENAAAKAMDQLWQKRSTINLVGNHIDVNTGRWTAHDATIGSGVDSYFEYLVKGGILLNKQEYLDQFQVYKEAIQTHLYHDNWYLWANMNKGHKSLPLFSSLDAYYPGLLSMVGDLEQARKTLLNYHLIWKQYGSLPEFYNIFNANVHSNREVYPLRPEFIESILYLYKATDDEKFLYMAFEFLESIEIVTKLDCGYATVKDVRTHQLENRMESFFLAETLKYLYLIFDKENFLNNDLTPKLVKNQHGECLVETGFYVFNTEAHPIDGGSLDCCMRLNSMKKKALEESIDLNQVFERYIRLNLGNYNKHEKQLKSKLSDEFISDTSLNIDNCNEFNELVNRQHNKVNSSYENLCNLSSLFKVNFQSMSTTIDKIYYP